MKVLFISNEIGVEAPGIVYEKLISNLSNVCDITVYASKMSNAISKSNDGVYRILPKPLKLPYLWDRATFAILSDDFLGRWWAKKSANVILREQGNADVVISAISSNNCETLYLGKTVSKALNAKWVVYSVDAIPAPLGWSKNNLYYRSLKRFINRQTKDADAFYSSNPIMLNYQQTCLSKDFHGKTGVVYTPFTQRNCKEPNLLRDPVFLYTGSLYGLRHVDTLMAAFSIYVKERKESKMIFVGNIDKDKFKGYEYLIKQGNLQLIGYTNNLDSYYSESSVLIDLSADIPNDVFLSSKVINYLPLKRPIIAIGGDCSAASEIFSEDKSIIISSYREEEILDVLSKSIMVDYIPDAKRNVYLNEMSDKAVAQKFYQELKSIVG